MTSSGGFWIPDRGRCLLQPAERSVAVRGGAAAVQFKVYYGRSSGFTVDHFVQVASVSASGRVVAAGKGVEGVDVVVGGKVSEEWKAIGIGPPRRLSRRETPMFWVEGRQAAR